MPRRIVGSLPPCQHQVSVAPLGLFLHCVQGSGVIGQRLSFTLCVVLFEMFLLRHAAVESRTQVLRHAFSIEGMSVCGFTMKS